MPPRIWQTVKSAKSSSAPGGLICPISNSTIAELGPERARTLAAMFRLLVVEDEPADRELFRILLRRLKRPYELYFAIDGQDALDFLHCRGAYVDAPRPNLILADLNMPRMGGLEFIGQVKSDPQLSIIPVIVLSTSTAAADIRNSYRAHANCYVSKPRNLQQADQIVQAIEAFWLDVAVLPECDEPAPKDKVRSGGASSHSANW
jgi:chemotaxis family two-component system response regulator Rcp1